MLLPSLRRLGQAVLLAGVLSQAAWADLASLSGKDAGAGLKEALTRGAQFAVESLGKSNGFLANQQVKILLPESLRAAEKMARTFGGGKYADELIDTMNHAAEEAVVEAKPILVNAIKSMSVEDAKSVLMGGEDAATQYFRRTTSSSLTEKFLPIVKKATEKVQLGEKYNKFAGKAAASGLLDKKDANLEAYVTQKALDGLFLMVAEQEKAIRHDPIGTGSSLLGKVFGAIK